MTTFYADINLFVHPKHEATSSSVEIPADDLHHALQVLMAWKAGRSASPRFDTAMEESLAASRTRRPAASRSATEFTLRQGAVAVAIGNRQVADLDAQGVALGLRVSHRPARPRWSAT